MIIQFRLTIDGEGSEISIIPPKDVEIESAVIFHAVYEEIVHAAKDMASEAGVDVSIKEISK